MTLKVVIPLEPIPFQVQALTNGTMQKKGKGSAATMAAVASANKLSNGLEGQGISSYIASMIRSFQQAGRALSEDSSQADTSDADATEKNAEALSGAESQRSHAVEQLSAVVRFPATTQSDVGRVMRFLAVHAFLNVTSDGTVGKSSDTAVEASGKKKKKQKKEEKAAEAVPLSGSGSNDAGEGLGSDSLVQVPVSEPTRVLCARRLFMLMNILAPHKQQRLPAAGRQPAAGEPGGQTKKVSCNAPA